MLALMRCLTWLTQSLFGLNSISGLSIDKGWDGTNCTDEKESGWIQGISKKTRCLELQYPECKFRKLGFLLHAWHGMSHNGERRGRVTFTYTYTPPAPSDSGSIEETQFIVSELTLTA